MKAVDIPKDTGHCSCSVHGRVKPYGLKEASEALGLAKSTLHDAVQRQLVPHTRIGRNILIPAAFVLKAIHGPDAQS